MNNTKFLEVILRGEEGEPSTEKEFDLKIFKTARKIAKKYGIKFDPENLVPFDEDMIDSSYEAGMELLLEMGVFNVDSGRTIQVSREELEFAIGTAKSQVILGTGKDKLIMNHRSIEDSSLPLICGGCGNPVEGYLHYKLYLAFALNPYIDYIEPIPPHKYMGKLVKAGSPFEMLACTDSILLWRKACFDAGRPGTPVKGTQGVSAATDIATNREDCSYRKTDHANVYFKNVLKTSYDDLNRAVQYSQYGMFVSTNGCGYIGGYAGGVESCVISAIAEQLASLLVYNTVILGSNIMEYLYPNHSTKRAIWGTNLASAAMNKHTQVPAMWGSYITAGGSGTEMCLQEVAAAAIGNTVMGNHLFGVAPNQGTMLNHCTPLESQMMAEVGYAATKIDRKKANEVLQKLIPMYEEALVEKNPPVGKPFQELYDMDKLIPTEEYLEVYEKVWRDLEGIGLQRYIY